MILLLLVILLSSFVDSCFIQGHDSGVCRQLSDLVKGPSPDLSYCASVITYPSVCVPRVYGGEITDFTTLQVVPWGIFSNHTVARKDKWVREYVGKVTARRLAVEAANGKVPGLRESSERESAAARSAVPRKTEPPSFLISSACSRVGGNGRQDFTALH